MKKNIKFLTLLLILPFIYSCAQKAKSMDIAAVWGKINTDLVKTEQISSLTLMTEAQITAFFDIKAELFKNAIFLISDKPHTNSSELVLIEAADSSALEQIQSVLAKRHQQKYSEWENGAAGEFIKIQEYKLISKNNYIIYVVSEKVEDVVKIFEEGYK